MMFTTHAVSSQREYVAMNVSSDEFRSEQNRCDSEQVRQRSCFVCMNHCIIFQNDMTVTLAI